MNTLSTTKEHYEELKTTPLLFLRLKCHIIDVYDEDNSSEIEKTYYWEPIDQKCKGTILKDERSTENDQYILVVIDYRIDTTYKKDNDDVKFGVWKVSANDINSWIYVINSYIKRSQDNSDLYPYIYLLWFLDKCEWSKEVLLQAINAYSTEWRDFVIRGIGEIAQSLSLFKQEAVRLAFKELGVDYTVYKFDFILDALKYVTPKKCFNGYANNLFELIDYIFSKDHLDDCRQTTIERNFPTNTGNKVICLYKWLNSDDVIISYQYLPKFYALVNNYTQRLVIQRYFHDVRLKKTALDIKLLEQFKDNPDGIFIRYRYCIETPQEKVYLGNSILADCMITLYNTQGRELQTFNGMLDFVISKCDITMPNVDLGLDSFLPKCNGGAVYNNAFVGFIDYSIIYKLDETRMSDENLLDIIKKQFYDYRHTYYQCSCKNKIKKEECGNECSFCDLKIMDEWRVPTTCIQTCLLEMFLNIDIESQCNFVRFNINDISVDKMRDSIRSFVSERYLHLDLFDLHLDLFEMNSQELSTEKGKIVKTCSSPVSMRFYPRNDAFIGLPFDAYGILKKMREQNGTNIRPDSREEKDMFIAQEAEFVRAYCVKSLSNKLNQKLLENKYFEVPYNENLLNELKCLFYVHPQRPKNDSDIKEWQRNFLQCKLDSKRSLFCAPTLVKEKDIATNLPFFWCRGTECFCNNIQGQTLNDCGYWWAYSLFHLAEIIGYSKLHYTEAGYEPDNVIKKFISVANKVYKKFNQLKCRSCGHLLYADKGSIGNRYNYYSCINPSCSEYMHPVYLNYCFKCKRGLIDSRNSKQCPNGWYICPTCSACCDDNLYELMAMKYIRWHNPVPERIEAKRGAGHNDKGMYFCYKCGSQMEMINVDKESRLICPNCGEK